MADKVKKNIREKRYYDTHKIEVAKCYKQYREAHKDKLSKYMKKYYKTYKYNMQRRSDRLILTAQAGYGGKCLFCEENRSEALVFHHVNEDGNEHRKEYTNNKFYQWIIENNFPNDIILLCANCHLVLHRRKLNGE